MAQPIQTTTGTGQDVPHSGDQFPPFNTATYPGQLVWLALTFAFLYVMVARVISPRLQGILSERRERIAADLAEAGAMKTKADAAGEAYETAIAEARKRAGAIAQEARTALSTEFDVRRKALEADLAAKLASAEDTIRAATASAMDNVRGIAVDAAGDIVELLTGRPPDAAAIHAAYDRVRA